MLRVIICYQYRISIMEIMKLLSHEMINAVLSLDVLVVENLPHFDALKKIIQKTSFFDEC